MVSEDKDFEGYKVYVYGYDSKFLGKSFSIDEVAESDLYRTLQSEKVLDYPKVIFVAHSMGGIVTRDLLLMYPPLQTKVYFIHFFATPGGGSVMANLASFLSFNPQFSNMKEMVQSDDYLAQIVRKWNSTGASSVKSFCSYEFEDTFKVRIVPFHSAVILCNDNTSPVYANHIDIVKPASTDAQAYRDFKASFHKMQQGVNNQKSIEAPAPHQGNPYRAAHHSRLICQSTYTFPLRYILEIGFAY